MRQQQDSLLREQVLNVNIKLLKEIDDQLSTYISMREGVVRDIIEALGHEHEGQKTYEYDKWLIECKTPFVYSLDTKKYKSGDIYLDPKFNPIKESVSYTVDKRLCEEYMNTAPESVRDSLVELITKRPSKVNVCIKERIR